MKTKIGVMFLVAVIASAGIGASYACVNGSIDIKCCSPCGIKFYDVTTDDNEFDDDVGDVTAQIVDCGGGIDVFIVNAYPLYESYIYFTIKNTGRKPIHIDEVSVEDYDTTALAIDVLGVTCIWISPGETIDSELTVEILQAAKQNWEYSFQVKINVSCEPWRHPRTIGFWKHQFRVALLHRERKIHIHAETLEQYLDEITSESNVYSFTGSQTDKFKESFNILKIPRPRTMENRLKAHLFALWLNDVSGFADGWKYAGMTSGKIIQGSENALINHQSVQYRYWKNMCDGFNNLR